MPPTRFSGSNRGLQVGRNDGSIIVEFHNSHSTEDIDRICLQALRCPDPFLIKNRLKTKDKLLRQSFEWVLRTSQYQSWKDGDDVCLLWIKGGAGKGKTMMSIGLIEALSQEDTKGTVVTYFFFQNGDNELNTLVSLIKGLIMTLVTQCIELKEVLRNRWDARNERFIEDFTSWQVLWEFFLEILDRCTCPRVYVVIDALDECQGDDMASFLKLVVRNGLDHPKKIKWLLTSRPSDVAERALIPGHEQMQVSLELNSDSVSESVKAYISHKVDELGHQNRYSDTLRNEVKSHLSSKAEGTFLWVSLVCKGIEEVARGNVLALIQVFPKGLHALYSQKLHDLRRHDKEKSEMDMKVLQVMRMVYRPLKVDEIPVVTGLDIDTDGIRVVAARCGAFIVIRENHVEFIHQSARDFLNGEDPLAALSPGDDFSHRRIVINCVSQLTKRLKVNLLGLPPNAKSAGITDSLDFRSRQELSCLDYAATFWVQHLQELDPDVVVRSGMIKDGLVGNFMHAKLLEWLECISLLNRLHTALDGLEGLLDIMKGMSSEYEFLQDASQFLRRHFNIVAQCPLQIYSAALMFSPESSIVRSENISKLPTYFRELPDIGDKWDYLLQSIRTEPVWSVSFSPDGKQFASGSSNGQTNLWDSKTGDCKLTLRIGGSSRILAVAFSPDGKTIATGSDDRIIRIYDIASGSLDRQILTSESRLEYPRSLMFSQDGTHIISGSMYGLLSYWDATTGEVRRALKCHSGPVNAIDISRDGKYLASGSSDRTIKLWNAVAGSWNMTIEGHLGPVQAVSFSSDSMTLASGSCDKTVRIWDVATGSLLNTIERHSFPIDAVKFSPSGKILASCSSDGYLHISDAATCAHLQRFIQDPKTNHTMEFSPNGRILATGSAFGYVEIWETATLNLHQPTGENHRLTDMMAISPDGNFIATSHPLNGQLDIWDAKTGRFRTSFQGHVSSKCTQGLVFSPDSKFIVSSDSHRIITLWNVESGHKKTLGQCGQATEYERLGLHGGGVNILSFSPNGKWIALGFDRNKINIWHATTGETLGRLSTSWSCVTAVAFPPDGTKIAASYEDQTIQIWDLTALAKSSKVWKVPLRGAFKIRPEREIKILKEVNHLEFSTDMRYLLTDGGLISLEDSVPVPENPSVNLLKLYVRDGWMWYGMIPFLRLSSGGTGLRYAAHGDRVIIKYKTFNIFIFEIDRGILQSALQSSGFWMDQHALCR